MHRINIPAHMPGIHQSQSPFINNSVDNPVVTKLAASNEVSNFIEPVYLCCMIKLVIKVTQKKKIIIIGINIPEVTLLT